MRECITCTGNTFPHKYVRYMLYIPSTYVRSFEEVTDSSYSLLLSVLGSLNPITPIIVIKQN